MDSLVDVIFKGELSSVNLSFLKDIIAKAKKVYFISPEIVFGSFEEAVRIINSNSYIDFVINTDELIVREKKISKVFINFGRDGYYVDVLFFFDLADLGEPTMRENIEFLKKWALGFKDDFKFDYFICQMDNADKEEYYFDSWGYGKLYDTID